MTEVRITTGGKEHIENATKLLNKAFEEDPVIMYLLSFLDETRRQEYLPRYFRTLLTAAALNNASLDEANEWSSCGILLPPGCRVDNPLTLIPAGILSVSWTIGIGGCQRMLSEYAPLADACKAKALGKNERYYYVFFLGTAAEARGKGLCSALVKHYQSIAAREQHPIWLEAITESSQRLYLKLGFVTVDEIVLGEGKAAADGSQCKNGPGVKIWGMIWRPTK